MVFASWTFDGYLLDIEVNSHEGDVSNYIKNGEWHLVKIMASKNLKKYSCCEEPYPEICYRLIIRRRPLFYVFNMVFPCLLITLVAFLGFFLPPGSSEKVSIGITTLLSITVFLMLVAESMPPTSEQLPLLGIYYAVTIGIVSFSTALAVVTLNIANKGNTGKKVPRLIKIIFFDYLARILCIELTSAPKSMFKEIVNYDALLVPCQNNRADEFYEFQHNKLSENYVPLISKNINRPQQYHHQKPANFNKNHHISNKIDLTRNNNSYLELNENNKTNHMDNKLILKSTSLFKSSSNHSHMSGVDDFPCFSAELTDDDNILKSNTLHKMPAPKKPQKRKVATSSRFEFLNELEKLLSKQFRPLIDSLIKTINQNEEKIKVKKMIGQMQDEWSDVAMIADHILCYFFCILTLASCFLIFFDSPHVLSEW
jgi:hypothetical protein